MTELNINKDLMVFAANARAVRIHRLQLTQRELSRKSGIAQNIICDIERGKSNSTINTFTRLAHALNVPLHNLFDPMYQITNGPFLN